MRKLKPQQVDWRQIGRFLERASKKLATAKKILEIDEEASFQQAYEAMLKASLAFMLTSAFGRGVFPATMWRLSNSPKSTWANSFAVWWRCSTACDANGIRLSTT